MITKYIKRKEGSNILTNSNLGYKVFDFYFETIK